MTEKEMALVTAIEDCFKEIVDCLCYQINMPLQHKTDLANKLCAVHKAVSEVNDG